MTSSADCLVARKVMYKEGEVIAIRRPFAWMVEQAYRTTNCYRCLEAPARPPTRCEGCKWAHYCSAACQKEDWIDRHEQECKFLKHPDLHKQEDQLHPWKRIIILALKCVARLKKEGQGEKSDFFRLMLRNNPLASFPAVYGPSTIKELYTLLDAQGSVCPDDVAFKRIRQGVEQNMTPNYAPNDKDKRYPVGMVVAVPSEVVDEGDNCQKNAIEAVITSGPRPRSNRIVAVRDIYEGEKVTLNPLDQFCTKNQRADQFKEFLKKTCRCPVCTDPAVEAERTPLKCQNKNCTAAIPNDERANEPCPSCRAVLSKDHLEDAQALLQVLDKFYAPPVKETMNRHAASGPLQMIEGYIKEGESLLHPTNIYLGLLYQDAVGYIEAHDKTEGLISHLENARLLEYAKKCLPIMEIYTNKYNPTLLNLMLTIVFQLQQRGEHEEAVRYAKLVMERAEILPGAGSPQHVFCKENYDNAVQLSRKT